MFFFFFLLTPILLPVVPEAKPSPSFPRSDGSSPFTAVPTVLNYWSWKPWRIVFEGSLFCKNNMNLVLHSINLIKIKSWKFSVWSNCCISSMWKLVGACVWMYPSITSISCFSAKPDNCGKMYFQDTLSSKWNGNKYELFYDFVLFFKNLPLLKRFPNKDETAQKMSIRCLPTSKHWPLDGSSYPLTNSISCLNDWKARCSFDSWTRSTCPPRPSAGKRKLL